MNQYEPYTCNKIVENEQLTVLFHIGNLIMVHNFLQVVIDQIKLLDGVHSTKNSLIVTRKKVHEYLDITINFSLKRGVAFSPYDFAKKLQKSLPNELNGPCKIFPTLEHMFKVDKNADILSTKRKDE